MYAHIQKLGKSVYCSKAGQNFISVISDEAFIHRWGKETKKSEKSVSYCLFKLGLLHFPVDNKALWKVNFTQNNCIYELHISQRLKYKTVFFIKNNFSCLSVWCSL